MFKQLLVTGSVVEANPPQWEENAVKEPIQVDLSTYQMTEVDVTLQRNKHNVVTSSTIILNDGIIVRVKGNVLQSESIVIRDLGYEA